MAKTITITAADDWHVHLRDAAMLNFTVPGVEPFFSRALIMPNLQPPLTTLPALLEYRNRIIAASSRHFTPFMTFYLNEQLEPQTLEMAKQHAFIMGAKLYPAGVTTNAQAGARSIRSLYPLLDLMQQLDLVLQVHGEVNHSDIFAREALFINEALIAIVRNFPRLRIVLEHISTRAAVEFVENASDSVAATITIHHLLYNRNHLLAAGLKPHFYCLPILKHANEQASLQTAALSGNPKFFAGSDSAPHLRQDKESACGCAGIYSAPFALPLYCQFFDQHNGAHHFEPFMSHFGADFYQMPRNTQQITLINKPQTIPLTMDAGIGVVVPIAAGETLLWSMFDE